jgi:hypothetical protein
MIGATGSKHLNRGCSKMCISRNAATFWATLRSTTPSSSRRSGGKIMSSGNVISGAAAMLVAGAMTLIASTAQAGMSPLSPGYSKPDIQLLAGGCGPGRHRLLGGGCSLLPYNKTQREYLQDLRPCQPGTHSESFPSPQGYRCVLNR